MGILGRLKMIVLREYQRNILNNKIIVKILKYLEGKTEKPESIRPVIVSPTGSGKTRMFCALANWGKSKNFRVLILVHRQEILEQTLKSMHSLGVTCGQIKSGKPMTSDLIQVAMVGTLVKRLNLVKRPDFILTDECHHTPSPTYRRIHSFWSSVPVMGWTATAQRLDGQGLGKDYDSMILGPEPSYLVKEGWLAMPILYRQPDEIDVKFSIKRGDFDQAEQMEVMSQKKIVGDVVEHYKKYMDGQPVIVSCVSVLHAQMMADVFSSAGYVSRAVYGDMNQKDRVESLAGLGNGKVQVVTFDSLIGEGVDIPAVAGVILLRRTLSLSLYLQIVGRALRPIYSPGFDLETVEGRRNAQIAGPKPSAIILDHAGNYKIHGHPLAAREWTLDSKKRNPKDEKPPTTTRCPKCYGIWPGTPRTCPSCGFSFSDKEKLDRAQDIKIIAGQLVEAGIDEENAETEAGWIAKIMALDPKKRQAALISKAFDLIGREDGRGVMGALVEAVGYKDGFAKWAWEYANKKGGRS